MPKKSALKCYFGCTVDGPLHRFPKWEYPHLEKFKSWKAVLSLITQGYSNKYIYNNIRFCYRHFEKCFQLPSHQLTKNAVPTLYLSLPESLRVKSMPTITARSSNQFPIECQQDILNNSAQEQACSSTATSLPASNSDIILNVSKRKLKNRGTSYKHKSRDMEQKKKSVMFYELCRLCLDEHGYCDIFERDGLSADIYRCTGVKVSVSDNLPQRICEKCLDIVTKAIDLGIRAKKNESHLKSLFGDDENEKTKESEDLMEIVTSTHFEKHNHKAPEEISSANEKFFKVRVDLFDSSVAKESTTTTKEFEPDSSKQPEIQQTNSHDCDIQYEAYETFYVIEDAVTDELSQPDSSQKPPSQKKIKTEDSNIKYECEICSKTFKTHKKLYLHNRLHTKNFACPINVCGKRFSSKGDVAKHLRTHTGEKPFACDLCDKRFAQRVTLRSHKEAVHSDG